jgi:BirA family biotin operon repressor/biotin-[acetyl-CoA-carboxylase] ligase
MSLLLRWPISDQSPPLLSLAAAVAVCDVAGPEARVKWPNDIVVEQARAHDAAVGPTLGEVRNRNTPLEEAPALGKLAGILIEGRPQEGWAVLGIGINVALRVADLPPDLRDTAATLGRGPEAIEPLLAELLTALGQRLDGTPAQTLDAWRERDALRERTVSWAGGRGRAAGIDGAGCLLVELPGGGHTALSAGEVHLALG